VAFFSVWKGIGLLVLGAGVIALSASEACTPKIGDKCVVSTDCSVQGDRLCDVSQPSGYCTQLNCRGNDCFDDATCVLFDSAVPGCDYNDRSGQYGSRVARSFCMAQCDSNSDCRSGYVCADPRTYPWLAIILDNDQSKKGCLPRPYEGQDAGDAGATFAPESPVCQAVAPLDASSPFDAAPASIVEAGTTTEPLFSDASDDGG
jgi:hypothetical protein